MAYKAVQMFQLLDEDVQRIAKIEELDPEIVRAHFLYVDAGDDDKGNRIKKMVVKYDGWKFKMNAHYGYGKWTAQAVLPTKEEVESFLKMMGAKLNGKFFCLIKGRVYTPDNPQPHEDFSHATEENAKGNSQEFLPEVACSRALRRVLERVTPWKNPKGYLMAEELDRQEPKAIPEKTPPPQKMEKASKKDTVVAFMEAFSSTYHIDKTSAGWERLFTTWCNEKSHKIQAPAGCKTFWDKINFMIERPESRKLLEEYIVLLTPAYVGQIKRSERLIEVNQKMRSITGGEKSFQTHVVTYLAHRMGVPVGEIGKTSETEVKTAQCEKAIAELEEALPIYIKAELGTDILQAVNAASVPLPLATLDLKVRLGVTELTRQNILAYVGQLAELTSKDSERVQQEILSRKAKKETTNV